MYLSVSTVYGSFIICVTVLVFVIMRLGTLSLNRSKSAATLPGRCWIMWVKNVYIYMQTHRFFFMHVREWTCDSSRHLKPRVAVWVGARLHRAIWTRLQWLRLWLGPAWTREAGRPLTLSLPSPDRYPSLCVLLRLIVLPGAADDKATSLS